MTRKPTVKILVVDDHEMTRDGLELLLAGADEVSELSFRGGLATFSRDLEQAKPDLVVLDLILQDGSGLQALDVVTNSPLNAKAIILTGRDAIADLLVARRKGAAALVSKADPGHCVLDALGSVMAGCFYCSPRFAALLAEADAQNLTLSKRQLEILKLLSEGLANKEIAHELGVTEVTVSHHLRQLRGRFGVQKVREILPKALELGLISALPS